MTIKKASLSLSVVLDSLQANEARVLRRIRKQLIKSAQPINFRAKRKLIDAQGRSLWDLAFRKWLSWLEDTQLSKSEASKSAHYSYLRFVDREVLRFSKHQDKQVADVADSYLYGRYHRAMFGKFSLRGLDKHDHQTAFNTAFLNILNTYKSKFDQLPPEQDLAAIFSKTYRREYYHLLKDKTQKNVLHRYELLDTLDIDDQTLSLLHNMAQEFVENSTFRAAFEQFKKINERCYYLLQMLRDGYKPADLVDWFLKSSNATYVEIKRCRSAFDKIFSKMSTHG